MKKNYLILIILGILIVGVSIYLIFYSFFNISDSSDILENPKQECERVGGTWKTFNNGCIDSCDYVRNPTTIFCTQILTDGCDCGPNKCWNGKTCENN